MYAQFSYLSSLVDVLGSVHLSFRINCYEIPLWFYTQIIFIQYIHKILHKKYSKYDLVWPGLDVRVYKA